MMDPVAPTAVVMPLFNEGRIVGDLVRRMPGVVRDVFVVDDGSTDEGPSEARRAGANVLSLGARRGVGFAIRRGLWMARDRGSRSVVVMAANGKDDPAEIPRLLDRLNEGWDYVQGSRFLPGGRHANLPFARGLMIRGYSTLFRLLTRFPATDVTNGFRAYRLALLDDPRIGIDQAWLDRYELEYYLYYKVITLGYRVAEVAVSKTYPPTGSYSKIRPIVDWWRMVRAILFLFLRIKE